MPYASTFEKANYISQRMKQGIGAPLKQTEDFQLKIEKMFNLIEQKTQSMVSKQKQKNMIQSTSIVADCIQRSIFGVFSQNYKEYKELPGKKDSTEIWRNFFI